MRSVSLGYRKVGQMIGYIVGLSGMYICMDGVASLWQYTRPERRDGQSWLRDHSFRLFRIAVGILLMILGYFIP